MERLRSAFCILLLMGCSTTPGNADIGEQVEVVSQKDIQAEDVVIAVDVKDTLEVKTTDLGIDSGFVDAKLDTPAAQCEPGEGCFLDPCDGNQDCLSGWCVQHLGENVCTQNCQEECPAGWNCQAIAGTEPDLVFVCVSDFANLCRPCSGNAECTSTGGAEDACIDYGPDGNFCGGKCAEDKDCPWGFSCKDMMTVAGSSLIQCVNDTGECPCTDNSVELGLATSCQVSNDFGTCQGKRICTEDGLSGCDAGIPGHEACNGIDDDCDSETDEPDLVEGNYINLCDDENDCTEDKCMAGEGCVNEVQNAGTCDDGNACTLADHCEAGTCLGNPVECADNNPCTDDICTETGGCDFPPNQEPCDDNDACTVADQCAEGTCTGVPLSCECHEDVDCLDLEDGDLCNGTLVCDTAGVPYTCIVNPETIVTCPEPEGEDAFCQQASCDPQTGECLFTPDHEGFLCSGGNKCQVNNICINGECTGGGEVNCNDGNPCTYDSCYPVDGCTILTIANGTPCLDQLGWHCMNGECTCVGDCQGKECGGDFCGGHCGTCEQNEECIDGQCIWSCVGTCEGKECGDDGCGVSCGDCPGSNNYCIEGTCVCVPNCNEKECGSDGCGGQCGTCVYASQVCYEGTCCTKTCGYNECGDDGCGDVCGLCEGIETCITGQCLEPQNQCDDQNDTPWDGCTATTITEFQINNVSEYSQYMPDVLTLPGGGFWIVFNSHQMDGDNGSIALSRHDSSSNIVGNQQLINSTALWQQTDPTIVQLADSNSVIAWRSEQPGSDYNDQIFGQVLSPSGEMVGNELLLVDKEDDTQYLSPDLSRIHEGFLLAYVSRYDQGPNKPTLTGFHARIFFDVGSWWDLLVNNGPKNTHGSAISTTSLSNGGAAVVWATESVDGNGLGIKWMLFDWTPDWIAYDVVNTYTKYDQNQPDVAECSNGEILIVWLSKIEPISNDFQVRGQRFSAEGDELGNEMVLVEDAVNRRKPMVVCQSDGSFVVVWHELDQNNWGIFSCQFRQDGQKKTEPQQVNTYFINTQWDESIGIWTDDSYIVVWDSDQQDGNYRGIFAQRFNPDGTKKYK